MVAFCGVLFEPFSGTIAMLFAGLAGLFLGSTEKGKRQHALLRYFAGRISTEKFNEIVQSKKPVELSGKKDLTVLSPPDIEPNIFASAVRRFELGFERR